MAADNVHYLSEGYANLIDSRKAAIVAHDKADATIKANTKASQHFWRGFRSPVGAKTCTKMGTSRGMNSTGFKRGRQGRQFHPYRRN
jgi:hypothetical protein